MSWYYFLCQDDHNELRRFVASYMWVGPLGLTLEILVEKKKNTMLMKLRLYFDPYQDPGHTLLSPTGFV